MVVTRAQSSTAAWYKVFTGTVSNQQATMHLHKAGTEYHGYLYFANNPWPLSFMMTPMASSPDSMNLAAEAGWLSLTLKGRLTAEASFAGQSELALQGGAPKKAPFQLNATAGGGTPFTYMAAASKASLPPQLKNQSTCEVSSALVWPAASLQPAALQQALKASIGRMLGMPAGQQPQPFITAQANKEINDWKKMHSRLSPKEAAQMGYSLSQELQSRIMVMYEDERVLHLSHFNYAYTGGAHGNYGSTLVGIDKRSNKPFTLADVLTPEGVKALPALLKQVAMAQYKARPSQPLSQQGFMVDEIPVSASFVVTKGGIGFLYSPYEIRSFADGEVLLQVPARLLENYYKPAFK